MGSSELYEKVYELFNIGLGQQYAFKNEPNETLNSLNIENYWIALVNHEWFATENIQPVVVALMKTDKGQKGLLIIPPECDTSKFRIPTPTLPIFLGDWCDPVSQALQAVNLLPGQAQGYSNMGAYDIQLKVRSTGVYGEFNFHGAASAISDTTSQEALCSALISTIHHFVTIYDNDEMHNLVQLTKRLLH